MSRRAKLLALVALAILAGCYSPTPRHVDALRRIDADAYQGTLSARVVYLDETDRCASFDPKTRTIRIHSDWSRENDEWLIGIIAHEAAHAAGILDHGPAWLAERERLARVLGIHVDCIPLAGEMTKIQVTRDMRESERVIKMHRDNAQGIRREAVFTF
jgi:hypothetical protein